MEEQLELFTDAPQLREGTGIKLWYKDNQSPRPDLHGIIKEVDTEKNEVLLLVTNGAWWGKYLMNKGLLYVLATKAYLALDKVEFTTKAKARYFEQPDVVEIGL